jgi:hypothetical protein
VAASWSDVFRAAGLAKFRECILEAQGMQRVGTSSLSKAESTSERYNEQERTVQANGDSKEFCSSLMCLL